MDDDYFDFDGMADHGEDDEKEASNEKLNSFHEDNNGDGRDETLAEVKSSKGKRKKAGAGERKSQLTLNANAAKLCGENGLSLIPKLFEDVKFKGKGRELDDLDTVMAVLETWTNSIIPNATFDEALTRIENLKKKSIVKKCLYEIRSGGTALNEAKDEELFAQFDATQEENGSPKTAENVQDDFGDIFNQEFLDELDKL